MKKSIEIVQQLIRYFDVQIIGTQLLVDAGLLHYDETNDIDVAAVKKSDTTDRVKKFLNDLGFEGEDIEHRDNIYSNAVIIRTKYTNPEFDKVIDINYFNQKPDVYSIPELVMKKFSAGRPDDMRQLSMVVFNKSKNVLKSYKELQDFYIKNKPDGESV